MRSAIAIALLVCAFFGTLSSAQVTHSSGARIDLGWIKAVQQERGWLVVPTNYAWRQGSRRLKPGDLLLAIDGHELSQCGPLAVARMLDEVSARRVPVTLERNGKRFQVLAFGEGVINLGPIHSRPQYRVEDLQKRGEGAPFFELPDTNGRTRTLSEFSGKWLLIVFWGTWCGGCIQEIPDLNVLAPKHKNDLSIVSIDLNDTAERLKSFMANHELSYTVLQGGSFEDAVARKYSVRSAPWNVLVSPEGEVVLVESATMNLESEVIGAIAERNPHATQHGAISAR